MPFFRLTTLSLLLACGQKNTATETAATAASEEKAQQRLQVKLGSTYEKGWNLRTVQTATQAPGQPLGITRGQPLGMTRGHTLGITKII